MAMMMRQTQTYLNRVFAGVRDAGGYLDRILAAAAATSLILVLFTPKQFTDIAQALIVIALVLIVAVIRHPRKPHVPPMPRTWVTTIAIPCLPADLDKAIGIARWYFGEDRIPTQVVKSFHDRCPYSVIVAKNEQGEVVGYVDLFLVRAESLMALVEGRQREEDLTERDLIGIDEARVEKAIYVGSIAVDDRLKLSDYERSKVVHQLIYACGQVCAKKIMDNNDQWQVCAIGYTKAGALLLRERLGFGERAAGRYWRTISRHGISRFLRNSPVAPAEVKIRIS